MPGTKSVVFALSALEKRRQAAGLTDGSHPLPAAGKNLVGVSLVTDIPDQPVVGGVEDIVQGNGEFDCAQARSQMAAGARDYLDQEMAYLVGQFLQLVFGQQTQVRRRVYGFEDRVGHVIVAVRRIGVPEPG